MMRKLRYGIVITAAVLCVGAVYLLTNGCKGEKKTEYTSGEESRIGVSDLTQKGQHGNNPESQESFDVNFYDPSEEVSKETEAVSSSEETETVTEPETSETEEETTTEEVHYFGLRSFFKGKLVMNSEKVRLYLNVREEPDDSSKILSVLWPGDIVTYLGKTGHWYEIQCDGYTGYVSSDYVLTDIDAYEACVDNIAYAAMAEHDSTYMYAEPDDQGTIILAAAKGDTFRLVGETGDYYEVNVVSELYHTLFVHKEDVCVFYLFLGPGNDNELSDAYEAYFGTLEIVDNLAKSQRIKEEAEEEVAIWQSAAESSREESKSIEQSYIQASKAEAERQRKAAAEEASRVASLALASGEAQFIGRYTITHYCHCPICCGIWGSNDPNYAAHGCGGMRLYDNYSVAVDISRIPLGTKLLINGKEYIAADTGVGPGVIDVYHQHHSDALAAGCYTADVYIIP